MARWDAPDGFVDFVRGRHAELLRFAHVLTGDRHAAGRVTVADLAAGGVPVRLVR